MAFLTATALKPRSFTSAAGAHQAARCRTRMSDEPATTAPIAPLNGDSKFAMKEPYELAAGKKAPVCRCWQSAKFPLCDGSHNKFNKETGSNIGPLVVSATSE